MSIMPMPVSSDVMALKDLPIQGPLIPDAWYQTITLEDGTADLEAIFLLARIVDDYCPVQMFEDQVDQVIGYCYEFKDVLLQRSYQHYESLFNFSQRQAMDIFERLENFGLLRRLFYTVKTSKKDISSMMFIKINPEKIEEITRHAHRKKDH